MESRPKALCFIILLGIISLFADMTYEGGRSITGPFLAQLGASAAAIGFVAGLGECFGYALRLLSGFAVDKTKRYWTLMFLGYGVNVFAMPLLALTYTWPTAAFLIIAERAGKAIRNPVRDALLSYASKATGRGYGFGLHSVLDQSGAMLGPLAIALVLYFQGSYRNCFALLVIPALFAVFALTIVKARYPHPRALDSEESLPSKRFSSSFWIYQIAMALIAAGYVDFALIAYHLLKMGDIHLAWIPLFYALAMATEGLSALYLGYLFDRYGLRILFLATTAVLFFAPLVFMGRSFWLFFGIVLWGIGMGIQASISRAMIANLVGVAKRGSAYGIFNLTFGISWFLGSAFMGWLYDYSKLYLVLFSCCTQAAALPLIFYLTKSPAIRYK